MRTTEGGRNPAPVDLGNIPVIYRVLAPSKRWLGMAFLNHQQYYERGTVVFFMWHFPNSFIFSYSLSCDSTADSGTDCQKEATSKSIFSHESHVVIGDWEAVFNAADTPRNSRKVTKPGQPPLLQNFI